MGQCKPIYGLRIDTFSQKILNRIARDKKIKKLLDTAVIIGIFNTLFTKSGVGSASFNISTQDWRFLVNAIRSTGGFQDNLIRRDIEWAKIHYLNDTNSKLFKFWEGIENGCKY